MSNVFREGKICAICGNPLGKGKILYCEECKRNMHKGTIHIRERKKKVKGYLDGLKVRADISQCRTCRFWDNHNKLCDYLNVTGKLRRCEPSPNCTKYERGKKKNERKKIVV